MMLNLVVLKLFWCISEKAVYVVLRPVVIFGSLYPKVFKSIVLTGPQPSLSPLDYVVCLLRAQRPKARQYSMTEN
jgi:hypothetical protein